MEQNTQVPNMGMLTVQMPAAMPTVSPQGGVAEDPRLYRAKVTKNNPSYKALLRPMPLGHDMRAYPYTSVLVHRIKDLVSGKMLVKKCCKNIPGVLSCPYCEDVWARYNAAKERGASKDELKKFLRQLAEEEWYGNFLIRQDENHPELNNQVKVWAHSKYQHEQFQTPVDNYMEKQKQAQQPQQQGTINVDTGDAFIPYDPVNGKDYFLVGTWDANKTYGDGRQGAPTYKGSKFVEKSYPLAFKQVTDPNTGAPIGIAADENAIMALLDQCHDLRFVFEDIPTPDQAIQDLAEFWQEANKLAQQKMAAKGGYGRQQYGQQQFSQQPQYGQQPQFGQPAQVSPLSPSFASQPFPTGGAAMPQNSIPSVPANAKIVTNSNPAAFMGQTEAAIPNCAMPNPIPESAAPVTTAYAQTPNAMNVGIPSAPATPAQTPATPGFAAGIPAQPTVPGTGFGMPAAMPAAMPSAQPASMPTAQTAAMPTAQTAVMPNFGMGVAPATPSPAAPAAPMGQPASTGYVPQSAPPLSNPVQFTHNGAPAVDPNGPIVETDSDDDLPF